MHKFVKLQRKKVFLDNELVHSIESLLDIQEEILTYNFRSIDIERISIEKISEDNPLKNSLLETKANKAKKDKQP